jgi:FkbM family methyltransferase
VNARVIGAIAAKPFVGDWVKDTQRPTLEELWMSARYNLKVALFYARLNSLTSRVAHWIKKRVKPDPQHRLLLVKSPLLPDGWMLGPNGQSLYFSSFNPNWFEELGVSPRVFLDVGSFDGGDALALKVRFPNARVVAIEADPKRADYVRLALAGTGIEILECAVLDRDRTVDFYGTTIDGEPSSQGSIFQFTKRTAKRLSYIEQAEQSIRVRGRSLSSILAELGLDEISLLHMDIQGAEYEALAGLGAHRPHMIHLEVGNEYNGARSPKAVHKQVVSMGYALAADFINDRLYVLQECLAESSRTN